MPRDYPTLLALFKTEVSDYAKKIDRDNEHCWRSLTLGWALAKGMTPARANAFAIYVRYNTDLA